MVITGDKIARVVVGVPGLLVLLFRMVIDFCLAAVALAYVLVFGPVGIMVGALFSMRPRCYLRVLLPLRLYALYVKALMDWRLCNFASAIVLVERVVSVLEDSLDPKNKRVSMQVGVLRDLYVTLTRMYMHCGRIDEAMLVVIRGAKVLPHRSLPGLAPLDVATAQLIRAAITAGRLVDSGGWATFTIRANTTGDDKSSKKRTTGPKKTAKVIPFPGYNNLSR